jgi:hypothetical protein
VSLGGQAALRQNFNMLNAGGSGKPGGNGKPGGLPNM